MEYKKTCVNVNGKPWEYFGYSLIAFSTFIMICQSSGFGASWVWKTADDVSTVLFTLELGTRMFEKGYLFFFTEDLEEKNWNFFDTLVVAISLGSMVITRSARTTAGNCSGDKGCESTGSDTMNKIKLLRTLRLLRLLRLLKVFKGAEKVDKLVGCFLAVLQRAFLVLIVVAGLLLVTVTMVITTWAGAKAWLATSLPSGTPIIA